MAFHVCMFIFQHFVLFFNLNVLGCTGSCERASRHVYACAHGFKMTFPIMRTCAHAHTHAHLHSWCQYVCTCTHAHTHLRPVPSRACARSHDHSIIQRIAFSRVFVFVNAFFHLLVHALMRALTHCCKNPRHRLFLSNG